jgi:surface antigen
MRERSEALKQAHQGIIEVHQGIVGVLATARLDTASRQALAVAAQQALKLTQELADLGSQGDTSELERNWLARAWDFLTYWVTQRFGF